MENVSIDSPNKKQKVDSDKCSDVFTVDLDCILTRNSRPLLRQLLSRYPISAIVYNFDVAWMVILMKQTPDHVNPKYPLDFVQNMFTTAGYRYVVSIKGNEEELLYKNPNWSIWKQSYGEYSFYGSMLLGKVRSLDDRVFNFRCFDNYVFNKDVTSHCTISIPSIPSALSMMSSSGNVDTCLSESEAYDKAKVRPVVFGGHVYFKESNNNIVLKFKLGY